MSSINLAPRLVSDMLALLGAGRAVYLPLLERMAKRVRLVRRLDLQTVDPATEGLIDRQKRSAAGAQISVRCA